MESAIKLTHVTKHLGKKLILKDISFETQCGEVFGFLGPNGAGKTTTIKLMTGLLGLEEGSIEICGYDLEKEFVSAIKRVGAIVENPQFYSHMTGYQNLKQSARMYHGIKKAQIQNVLELVDLTNSMHKKVSSYSLGMKQRLGIAQCLLHEPKVLILDEPTNGLDPAGIRDLRDIVKKLAHEQGCCVLVSSHLMSEMELMCDRLAIIKDGELISVRSLGELVTASRYADALTYQIETPHGENVADLIYNKFHLNATPVGEHKVHVLIPVNNTQDWIWNIIKYMVVCNEPVYSMSLFETKKLEDAFLELTKKEGAIDDKTDF
ncbi:MAG: ABC transporter ATP-binding protein [Lachnospiraceae bacterium]